VNLVFAGFAIKNATEKAMDATRASLGSDVTLSYNMQSLMENREKNQAMDEVVTSISVSDADKLKDLDYVESVTYIQSVSASSDDVDPVEMTTSDSDSSSSSSSNTMMPQAQGQSDDDNAPKLDDNDFTIQGQTTMATLSDFVDENYVLSSGRLLSEEDADSTNAVISTTLAEDNDLEVGDTFTVTVTIDDEEVTKTLTIVGLYEIESTDTMTGMSNRQSPYNTIYTSLEMAQTLNGDTDTISSAVYTLDDPDHIEAFEALAADVDIDWDTYTLDADDRTYEMAIGNLENMNTFSTIFLAIVIVVGAAILALILILTLKSRFYEFGILLSMGQSKIRIILQQFVEIGLIAAIAFTISLGSGQLVSNTISSLLSTTTTQSQGVSMSMDDQKSTDTDDDSDDSDSDSSTSNTPDMSTPGGMMQAAFTQPESEDLDVSLTAETAAELGAVTALICVVSILVPSIVVFRLSPRAILTKKEG